MLSRKFGLITLFVLVMLVLPVSLSAQDSGTSEIVVVEASGPVVPAFGSYIERGLRIADEHNAEAVVIMLDTPGGSVDVTIDLIQAMRNSDVPVVVYVGPPGAQAASAGLLITLGGHVAAMAPDTAIGATSVVGSQGEDLPSTAEEKAEQYVSAQARSLAERRGEEAVELANDAVFDAKAVSASEALDANLVDLIAIDLDTLLDELDGFEVEVGGRTRTLETSSRQLTIIDASPLELFLMLITHPNIVAILLAIGPLAIIIEIRAPGGWVLGTVGVLCLVFGLYGVGVLPVNWLGIVFFILAIALFILEVSAPTHGVLTAAGTASLAVGIIVLFSDPEIEPFGTLSIPLVIAQSVIMGSLFFGLAIFALRAQRRQPTTGLEGLVGQIGRVTTDLDPVGTVLVAGERWKAEAAEGGPIPIDREVEIVSVDHMRLRVRPRT